MSLFTYAGEPGRYYPTLGLAPEPDATYELEAAPDARFVASDADAAEMARVEAERVEAERATAAEAERLAADNTEKD